MSSIAQRAIQGRNQRRERPQPNFIARAKVGNGWVTIGAAWPFRSGKEGYSLQLTTVPLNWDGRFVLLPPLGDGEETADPEEDPDALPTLPPRQRHPPVVANGGKPVDDIPF
jgi:hypothetical protein